MKEQAYAKINLALDVVGERPDGYHDVRMIMQSVSLCDEVELLRTTGDGSFYPRVDLQCRYPLRGSKEPSPSLQCRYPLWGSKEPSLSSAAQPLPTDDRNLAVRAAKLLMDEFAVREPLTIRLTKRIPVAAGLAGGSADAAAVIAGVNRLFSLGLSQEELIARGAKLGADVPFCLLGGTALAEGIGERLTPLPPMPECTILIAKPGIDVSTQFVYTNLRMDAVDRRPDIDGMWRAIEAGDLEKLAGLLSNVLESVTCPLHPEIEDIKDFVKAQGALGTLMSGSGPTVFGLFADRVRAEAACSAAKESGLTEVAFLAVPQKREESA